MFYEGYLNADELANREPKGLSRGEKRKLSIEGEKESDRDGINRKPARFDTSVFRHMQEV